MIAAGIIMNNFILKSASSGGLCSSDFWVTILNLFHVVDKFGESEFWLSWIKIVALAAFSIVVPALICPGLISAIRAISAPRSFLGSGGFAPNGYWSIVLTMVIILVNPRARRSSAWRLGECEKPEKIS